tara:strand:- start:853 stop:1680 length:828 start_codon:yes stop_codon:yes gene_type:complete
MSDTTFVDQQTVVPTTWLNDLNDFFYTTFNGAIDATAAVEALGAINSVTNIGTGEGGVGTNISSATLELKTLKAGNQVTITESATEVTINSSGTPMGGAADLTTFDNTVTNNYTGTNVQDVIDEIIPFNGALVVTSVAVPITALARTNVPWNTSIYDTDSWHDTVTNNSRITIPAGVTRARFSANIFTEAATTASSMWQIEVRKNGGILTAGGMSTSTLSVPALSGSSMNLDLVRDVTPGDYYEITVLHTDSVSHNVQNNPGGDYLSWFAVEEIS